MLLRPLLFSTLTLSSRTSLIYAHSRPLASTSTSTMSTFASSNGAPQVVRSATQITITPPNPTALLIIMHGLGDTADGFFDVANMWSRSLPHVKFILPTAPTTPVTMNMGMAMPSWYDIAGLDERTNEVCEGITESRERIRRILEEENEGGLPYSRMAVSGFSQGGALSLFVGLLTVLRLRRR